VMGSGVGGDHLSGSAAGGILIGHRGGNVLKAGLGRSLVIGGFGRNLILGGSADDILINGRTSYDANYAVLSNILTIWQSASTYPERVAALQAAGPNQLKIGATVFVFPGRNGGIGPRIGYGGFVYGSTLVGNGGRDWFLTHSILSVVDRKPGEIVTTS
jgi:Ca2+-binding RTX toxin-like protein